MAPDIIRDSFFGHLLRIVFRNRILRYPEERDAALAGRYYHYEKSSNMAKYGQTTVPRDEEKSSASSSERKIASPSEGNSELNVPNPKANHDERDENVSNIAKTPVDSEKGRDVTVIDWDGPNDPENPRCWSMGKKFFVTFEICLLTVGVYIGSAIYTPGLMGVMDEFGVSEVVATLGLTLFVLGYGLGPMIWSPMSEVPQIGRMPVYIGTLIVFVALQVPTALASNIGSLLAFRFLTGFFGSPVLATGGATLADMYYPNKQAYALSIYGIAAVIGPALGPLASSFAVVAKGWRWTIWEILWVSGAALIVLFFFLPETSSSNILYRKMRRIQKITGDKQITCEPVLEGESLTRKDIIKMLLVTPFTLSFTEPVILFCNLYIGLVYSCLYLWFSSFAIVFLEDYHFKLGIYGTTYLGLLIGALVTLIPFWAYLYYIQEPQFKEYGGNLPPEKRMVPALFGSFCLPICLFWFGWTAGRTHWIVPIIGSAWFAAGAMTLFNSILSYLGDAYPSKVASVYASNDLIRSGMGGAFPLFGTAMFVRLGIDWGCSLLGFLSIAFIPLPFILYKHGKQLRMRSKNARKDI